MKIKLPKTEKKVIIDEKRGIVTTLLIGAGNPSIKFVGVAKCNPEDTFNADIGAKISYRRAKCKLLVRVRNEIRTEIQKGKKYAEMHEKLAQDVTKIIDELKQSIDNILM